MKAEALENPQAKNGIQKKEDKSKKKTYHLPVV